MTEAEIEKLINDIYLGVVHVEHLPLNVYLYASNHLLSGLYQGYGYTLTELIERGVAHETMINLSRNIYHFSAAKTFQQVYDLQQGLIVDGFKVSFSDYKKYATAIVDQYNKNWLKVEYNTTIMSAMAASEWQTVYNQRSQFPLLQYQTVRDGRVRPDHARLDNIVRPVNDVFWNSFYPPNGWQCRCIVVQLEKGAAEITQLSAADKKEIKKDVPEVFRNNPGKSGKIFADHHPYFDVPERYQELKKNNFNLPLPL